MEDERLLERFRSIEKNPTRRKGRDDGRLIRSVLSHLEGIPNIRQGSVPIADDYGVPDFTNFQGASLSESTYDIERSIRQVILTYEHRLRGVRVGFIPQEEDILALRFKITAKIDIPIAFNTVIGTGGRIDVSD
jgi:type VI secretion system protein